MRSLEVYNNLSFGVVVMADSYHLIFFPLCLFHILSSKIPTAVLMSEARFLLVLINTISSPRDFLAKLRLDESN